MIEGNKILAIIPARSGSKGVPGKNLRLVHDKPLVAYSIEEAKKSEYIDKLVISSDDKEIIRVAKEFGAEAPFVRPSEIAQDSSPVVETIEHALANLREYDYFLLLQPTSPLRLVSDIDECIQKTISNNAKACISVTKPDDNPYWMFKIDSDSFIQPIIESNFIESRRQDLPTVYIPNGALYFAECDWFLEKKCFVSDETIAFIMPEERSIDIDTENDFKIFEDALYRLIK